VSPAARPRDVEVVFRALAGPVHGYLRASGARESEDLLGDVFVDVTRSLARFEGDDDALRRWVFTIAHNRLVDERRRVERGRRLAPDAPTGLAAQPEPFDPELEAALDQLTPEQRDVIVLRFVADLPLDAVASLTGRNVGAVKALQHRALARLQTQLRPSDTSSEGAGTRERSPVPVGPHAGESSVRPV
jgi:RNA polymerase sigma factor (sigma-70 family)